MKTVAIVPMKLNNRRLPQKNTKPFSNGKPLCFYILSTLLTVEGVDEVYVYCSNPDIQEYIPEGVKYLRRSESLDQDTTSMTEVLTCFTKDVPADIYVMTHTTAPFISKNSIEKGLRAVESGKYDFLRTNYPNGDMVGHTGDLTSTIIGVEAVDIGLKRVMESVDKVGGILLITADHGNADEMYQTPKAGKALTPKTSHTLNRVPFIVYGAKCTLKTDDHLGLANIASTVAHFLGIEPNEHWEESLIK